MISNQQYYMNLRFNVMQGFNILNTASKEHAALESTNRLSPNRDIESITPQRMLLFRDFFVSGCDRPDSREPTTARKVRLVTVFILIIGYGDQPLDKLRSGFFHSAKPASSRKPTVKQLGDYDEVTFFESELERELANAITQNQLRRIRKLVAAGTDMTARSKYGITALVWALFTESLPAFHELIAFGADPDLMLDSSYPKSESE